MRIGSAGEWSRQRLAPHREGDSRRCAPLGERTEALGELLLVALAALLVYLTTSAPTTSLLFCPFRWLTGWPCPGCGMTRAFGALVQGQWERALSLHPLSPIVALGWLLFGLSAFSKAILPSRAPFRHLSALGERILMTSWTIGLALALVLGVWGIRLIALIVKGEASELFRQGWLSRL